MRSVDIKFLHVLGLVWLTSGCAASARLEPLAIYENTLATRYSTGVPEAAYHSTEVRNRTIDELITLANVNYSEYEIGLYQTNAAVDTLVDIAILGSGIAGASFGSEVAQVLSGVVAGLSGSKIAFDKNFYAEKSRLALISKMNALRSQVLESIEAQKDFSTHEYTMSAAMLDVQRYVYAGSTMAALQAIVEESGAELKASRATLMKMKLGGR